MRWKNYRYNITEEGVVITKYLAGEHMTDSAADQGQNILLGFQTEDEPETAPDEECAIVPAYIDGHPVVEIGEEAFSEYGAFLSKVEVPSTVKRIGSGAFRMCMSLTELVLHDGVETIGEEAFYLTPIAELYLPTTVSEIGHPWELGSIQWKIDEKSPYFFSDGYGLYSKRRGKRKNCVGMESLSDTERVTSVESVTGAEQTSGLDQELLVVFQQDERTEYEIAYGTTIIGESAFAGNTFLQKVIVPSTVHTIREAAFESCQSLSETILSEGLKEIQTNAFSHCIRLKEIHLSSTLERLGEHALSDTFGWSDSLNGLERITVEAGNVHFEADEDALFECGESNDRYIVKYFGSQREYRIPEDVTRILPSAFRRANIHKFTVPESLKDVGLDAFRECKNLEEICLEESDTVLYVPRQPVYRKDEITALFFSEEHEHIKEEAPSLDELPEKWQAFVGNAIYSRAQEPQHDPYEEFIFDYRGYDALFHTYLNLPDHCGMACCRLKYPVLLPDSVRRKYEEFIRENLMDILNSLAESQDMYHLATLAELGFFTEKNIEECLDVFNRSGRTKLMSYLMNYKLEKLAKTEFDFNL